jgi:hypothetical protein
MQRELRNQILEDAPSMFVILELIETGACWSEEYDVAWPRRV